MQEDDRVRYMRQIQDYARSKCVFEVLQRLKKELVFAQPENPLDWLS